MKISIKGHDYKFIWGTKCFINVQNQLGHSVDAILSSISNPEVLSSMIYNGLNLWCDKNNVDRPFNDFEEFVSNYDTLGDYEFYEHIVTDILESAYVGSDVATYLEKKFSIVVTDLDKAKKAKKKYQEALEKSSSNSAPTASAPKKSNIRRLPNTK